MANYYSSEIVVTDINADGFNDIITYSSLYSNCKWLENPTDGSTNWTEHTVIGNYHFMMGVFDVDGDLMPDIFLENLGGTLGWVKMWMVNLQRSQLFLIHTAQHRQKELQILIRMAIQI